MKDRIELTFTAKGFKKCVGRKPNADGTTSAMIWYFGQDTKKAVAEEMARVVVDAWRNLQLYGDLTPPDQNRSDQLKEVIGNQPMAEPTSPATVRYWTPETINRVRTAMLRCKNSLIGRVQTAQDVVERFGSTPTSIGAAKPANAATLYGAIKSYLESLKGKRLSEGHKQRSRDVLEGNLKAIRDDVPMNQIDFAWIDTLCDHFKSRPKSTWTGKAIKPMTVVRIMQYVRMFFTWCDDTNYGKWEAPRKLAKPFKVKMSDLMTPAEIKTAGTIEQFDKDTLVKLYQTASEHMKTCILLGIFCGFTQKEIAVLERSEFDLDQNLLEHHRNKTHVQGSYWLPDELVKLLKVEFKKGSGPLAITTDDGNPVVSFTDGRKMSDSIRQAWDDLRKKAGVPDAPSFKFLRKSLADFAMLHGGEQLAQIALAHASQTVAGRFYSTSRDFPAFHRMQKQMHAELTLVGMFGPANNEQKQTTAKAA